MQLPSTTDALRDSEPLAPNKGKSLHKLPELINIEERQLPRPKAFGRGFAYDQFLAI